MSKRVFYGRYQIKRRRDNKKRFLILLLVLVAIGAIIWLTLFFGTTRQHDVGSMVKDSVSEITQLKLELKEKDDEIAALNQKIADYEAELAIRPTLEPTPLVPPNDAVSGAAGTPTPAPQTSRTPRPKRTEAPKQQQQQTTPPPVEQAPAVQEPVQEPQTAAPAAEQAPAADVPVQ